MMDLPAAWPPARYTAPLAVEFESLYDRFRPIVSAVWSAAFGYDLRQWQHELLRAILELRDGHLRYRQVLVSVARQNGKTEVAAALALIGLLRGKDQDVVGIAQNVDAANLVYNRTRQAVRRNPQLAKRFKGTGTRGIRGTNGSQYFVRPNRTESLQGIPVDTAIVDEVHVMRETAWGDLLNGAGARPDALVAGLTTAGNDGSKLLKRLYELGREAMGDPEAHPSVGVFIWEAESDRIPEDRGEFIQWLAPANPSMCDGLTDPAIAAEDALTLPPSDILRYRGNRFVSQVAEPFVALDKWLKTTRPMGNEWPDDARVVFSIDRTPDWGYGSIVAVAKDADGIVHAELVQSFVNPDLATLADAAMKLRAHAPLAFAVDKYNGGDLGAELKRHGLPVRFGSKADAINAASLLYAKIAREELLHADDDLLTAQVRAATRKSTGDTWRIAKTKGSALDIDALQALALGVLVVETTEAPAIAIY